MKSFHALISDIFFFVFLV